MSVRNKTLIVSVVLTLLFQVLEEVNINVGGITTLARAFVIALVLFLGIFWVTNFNVQGQRFLTILLTPSYSLFILSIFLELVIFGNIVRIRDRTFSILLLGFFGLYTYLQILTVNILNISSLKKIPLGQAAKAAQYVFSLISLFMTYLILFSSELNILIRIVVIFFATALFCYSNFWLLPIATNDIARLIFGISLLITTFSIVFSIWPISAELISLFLVVFLYIILGLGLELSEKIAFIIWAEYSFLIVISILLILNTANWGINGTLL